MGSCVSRPEHNDQQHHIPNPNPDPAVADVEPHEHHKLKDFIPAAVLIPHSGSTDESFFDAQPWIESDCDDEFYSVNGDYTPSPGIPHIYRRFSTGTPLVLTPSPLNSNVPRLMKVNSTPSRTNTPLHVIFAGTPQSNELFGDKELAGYKPEISPGYKRLKLLEHFRLSRGGFGDEHFLSDKKSTDTKTVSEADSPPTSCNPFTPAPASVCSSSSKRTSNASSKSRRSIKAVHPIDCLRKLRNGRHRNEKKMDEENVIEV